MENVGILCLGLIAAAVFGLGSCSSASATSTVTNQAAIDLSCPEQIQIQQLSKHKYEATGCGQKASYILNCTPWGGCMAEKQSH